MKKVFVFILYIALCNNFQLSYSQRTTKNKTVDELFKLSLDEFLNVVITPSKLPQLTRNITQKVDFIDSKEIETTVSGNQNICEIITKLPGSSTCVLSRNDANWGTYGGIGPKYSTYMLQGVPIDAFMDPMSLDLNAVDHIEVQRGPASVIYPNYLSQDFAGSQSPLGGTVNLILKDSVERQKTTVQMSFGSYNTLNSQVFNINRYNHLTYFFGSSFEMSDYTNYGSDGSWLNMKKNPEYRKIKIYGGLTLFMNENKKQKLSVFCQRTWHNGDVGRVYRGFANQYITLNLGYDISLNRHFHLQSHFGARYYDRSQEESNFGTIDTLKSRTDVTQLIIPVDISLSWSKGEKNTLSIGVDYQGAIYNTWIDSLAGNSGFSNISSALQEGVYIQEEWQPVKMLSLRGGLRYSYIKNTIDLVHGDNPVNKDLSWNKLLWSFGTKYSVNDRLTFFTNIGSSFITPSLKSIGGTIPLDYLGVTGRNGQLPNPDLKPENGIGIDAGMDCKFSGKLKLGIRCFYTILQNGIVDNVVSLNPSQTQSINTQSTCKGAEIEISQKISSTISFYANGTLLFSNIKDKTKQDQNNVDIPFSPNILSNVGMTLKSPSGLTLVPSLNYNGGFYDAISKANRQWYAPHFLLNTYLSQLISREDNYSIECVTQLYNITNNKYDMPWQFKNTGFSCMLGIRITFM
jgi:iron complex outermembrane recepter protein